MNNNLNFMGLFNPQMHGAMQNLYMQAMQSGNPQQFMMQKFGNDRTFKAGFEALNSQGIQGLYNFIASNNNR